MVDGIQIERQVEETRLQQLGVGEWPSWEQGPSSFPWHYDSRETCYFICGEVLVTPLGGEPQRMGKGDLVSFAQGLECHWEILSAVKKVYNFD